MKPHTNAIQFLIFASAVVARREVDFIADTFRFYCNRAAMRQEERRRVDHEQNSRPPFHER